MLHEAGALLSLAGLSSARGGESKLGGGGGGRRREGEGEVPNLQVGSLL